MAVDYAKSCLIGALMECIAYGLYFTFFLQSVQVLRRKLVKGAVFAYLSATTIVLFVLITMRMVLDNKAAVEAFTNDPITPNAADIYYTSFGNGAMFRTGTYIALTIIADIFIVYRVFAVWSRNYWVTLVPFLLAIADIVSGALVIRTIRHLEAGASPDGNDIATHIMIFYGFTLGLNMLSTLLIALKFYIVRRQLAASKMASLGSNQTLVILVESAALYSLCLIVILALTAQGDNAQYCMLSMMPGIVGLAFSLVIVRVGSGISPSATLGPGNENQFFGATRSELATSQFGSQSQSGTTTTDYTQSANGSHGRKGMLVHFGKFGNSSKHSRNEHSRSLGANTSDPEKDSGSDQGKEEV